MIYLGVIMGFYKIDYEILDFLKADGMKCEKVLEFGSQDIKQDREGNDYTQRVSTESIYKDYGFNAYKCIDMDGGHNALLFDLGNDLQKCYGFNEKFNLVTIKEIGHWIFDQKTLFTNIHNAVEDEGYIIWRSPIVGGYSAGCFAYMPNKILQLGFCNNYLYKGAWIYEQLPDGSIHNIYEFNRNSAYGFLEELKQYVADKKSLHFSYRNYGEYMMRLTMVFKKLGGGWICYSIFPLCVIRQSYY